MFHLVFILNLVLQQFHNLINLFKVFFIVDFKEIKLTQFIGLLAGVEGRAAAEERGRRKRC